jgi:glutamate racemase
VKRHIRITLAILALVTAFDSCMERQPLSFEDNLGGFFQKKEVTIAVTDSGLGGLSILAEAVERMRNSNIFRKVDFVFFNALFSSQGGYNSLKTQKEKTSIFDSALRSLTSEYKPDLILIGCNTLSILYESTPFAVEKNALVVGIVDSGVDLIARTLKNHPQAKVILLGTQTTVEEGTHKKRLLDMGFLSDRIVTQACPDLVSYIEKGRSSDETELLIFAYADEALRKLSDPEISFYVSFNCTHYGYSLDLWEQAFLSLGVSPKAFLNPNSDMIHFLFPPELRESFRKTEIKIQVVSMVEIGADQIVSIGGWLNKVSPQTAEALKDYRLNRDLFEWKKHVTSER